MPHRSSDDKRNVIFNSMPAVEANKDANLIARWDRIHEIRDDVKKALENARAAKVIGASLEAEVTLYATGENKEFVDSVADALKDVFIVSAVNIVDGEGGELKGETGIGVTVKHASGHKCERCWSYSDTVGTVCEHPTICARCAEVVASK